MIRLFRYVWLGIELSCTGKWISRARAENPWVKISEQKHSKHFALLLAGPNGRSAQVLLTLAIPGHLVFIYTIYLIQGSPDPPTAVFIFFYLAAAFTQASERDHIEEHMSVYWFYSESSFIQVFLLLGIVDVMVHCLWKWGRDPDSFSIPYLTALADLLGTGFLTLCFLLISLVT